MTSISEIPHLQKSFLPLSFGLLNTPLTGGVFTTTTLLSDVFSPSTIFTDRHEQIPLCQHFCVDGFIHIPLNSNRAKTYPPFSWMRHIYFPTFLKTRGRAGILPLLHPNLGFSTMSNILNRSLILHQDSIYLAWPLPSPQSCCFHSLHLLRLLRLETAFLFLPVPVKDLVSNISKIVTETFILSVPYFKSSNSLTNVLISSFADAITHLNI